MSKKLPFTTSKWERISWYNKPVWSKDKTHKKVVLAKVWEKIKLIRFWAKWYSDYTKHKDSKRRSLFRKRHAAIKTKDWKPAHKNKLQASYRAYNKLW
jgi:hypothetical protein